MSQEQLEKQGLISYSYLLKQNKKTKKKTHDRTLLRMHMILRMTITFISKKEKEKERVAITS